MIVCLPTSFYFNITSFSWPITFLHKFWDQLVKFFKNVLGIILRSHWIYRWIWIFKEYLKFYFILYIYITLHITLLLSFQFFYLWRGQGEKKGMLYYTDQHLQYMIEHKCDSGSPCLMPNFRGKLTSTFHIKYNVFCRVFGDIFIRLRMFSCIITLLKILKIINGCCISWNAFSAFGDDFMIFFLFSPLM